MNEAEALFFAVEIWGGVGGIVAAAFLLIGIDRIDEDARGAYIFRPLLVPAILLIWPLVLWRWYVLETGADKWPGRYRPPRRLHLTAAIVVAVSVLAISITGIGQKQSWPANFEPVQLLEIDQ